MQRSRPVIIADPPMGHGRNGPRRPLPEINAFDIFINCIYLGAGNKIPPKSPCPYLTANYASFAMSAVTK